MKQRPPEWGGRQTLAKGSASEGTASREGFIEADWCLACNYGILVRRRDGRPGRRCCYCGTPEPGFYVTADFGDGPRLAFVRRPR